jgi:hypothetical protein
MIYLKKVPEVFNCDLCFFDRDRSPYCAHPKYNSNVRGSIGCGYGKYIFMKATEAEIIAYQKRTGNKDKIIARERGK